MKNPEKKSSVNYLEELEKLKKKKQDSAKKKKEEERRKREELENFFINIDETIKQASDPKLKNTLLGLKKSYEDTKKVPTLTEKILEDIRKRTDKKPY